MSNDVEIRIKKLQDDNKRIAKVMKELKNQFGNNFDEINALKDSLFKDVEISLIDLLKGTYNISEENWYQRLKEQNKLNRSFFDSCSLTDKGTSVSLYIDNQIFEKYVENFKNVAKVLEEIKDYIYKSEDGIPSIHLTTGLETLNQYMIRFKDNEWHFVEKDYKNDDITLLKNKDLFDTIRDTCNWQKKELEAEQEEMRMGF